LTTPGMIRELQIKLYRKAKDEPGYRFYMLHYKIYREVYARARANGVALLWKPADLRGRVKCFV